MTRSPLPLCAAALALAAGCDGVREDRALDAQLVVDAAQFFEGAMPAANGGPRVVSLDLPSSNVRAGQTRAPLRGALEPTGTAAAIGLVGDRGFWIVPSGLADVASPGYPTFGARMAFAPTLPDGARTLVVRAVDADGRFGDAETRELRVTRAAPVAGAFVVSLRWDTPADLDLHVVDPTGNEVWKGDLTSAAPDAGVTGGALDFDSHAGCVPDGLRRETVTWSGRPPPGRYVVRVDTFSLCGGTHANWQVDVFVDGARRASAQGVSDEVDASFAHGRGAGLVALELDVP